MTLDELMIKYESPANETSLAKGIPIKWTIGTMAKINMITKPIKTPLIIA